MLWDKIYYAIEGKQSYWEEMKGWCLTLPQN